MSEAQSYRGAAAHMSLVDLVGKQGAERILAISPHYVPSMREVCRC